MDLIQFASRDILGTLQILFQQAVMLRIVGQPTHTKRLLLSSILIKIITVLLETFIPFLSVGSIFLRILLTALSYYLIFKQSCLVSIGLSFGQMLLIISMEYISYPFLLFVSYIWQLDFYDAIPVLMVRILVLALLAVVCFLIPRIKRILSAGIRKDKIHIWIIYILFVTLFTFPNIYYKERRQIVPVDGIDLYNSILFFLLLLYSVVCAYGFIKISNVNEQLDYQQLYTETLENTSTQLQSFKHDYANTITTISGMVAKKDLAGLERYVKELNAELLGINNTKTINDSFRHIDLLYGMLLTKSSLAELNGIEFRISIPCELKLHYCSSIDFSKMVGILLDNAYDAAKASEKKHVFLSINEEHQVYRIIVRNSYQGPVDLSAIFDKGVTSKEGHSGLGLHIVKSIVGKYRKKDYAMEFDVQCDEDMFTAILTI